MGGDFEASSFVDLEDEPKQEDQYFNGAIGDGAVELNDAIMGGVAASYYDDCSDDNSYPSSCLGDAAGAATNAATKHSADCVPGIARTLG